MCCRCPPNIPPISPVYFLLNIVFCFYFCYISDGLYLVGPTEIEILSINNCHGFDDKLLQLRLNVNKVPSPALMITGNISLAFDLDGEVKINISGNSISENGSVKKKAYINHKSFCELLDNYIYRHTDLVGRERFKSFCPISSGFYRVTEGSSQFSDLDLPYEILGHRIYQMELIRKHDVLACKEFDIKCTAKVADVGVDNNNYN